MTTQRGGADGPGLFTRMAAPTKRARGTGGVVMIAAVVILSFNLRPAVNALGVVMPELQDETGLSGTVAGVLLALPTLCFAAMGIATASLATRWGSHLAVLTALIAVTGGQVLRATVDGAAALFAGSVLALAGIAVGNVLLPGLIRRHFPTAIAPMTALYTTVLMIGQTMGAGLTLPVEHALGGTWRLGIGMWALTAALALVPWVVAAFRYPSGRRRAARAAAPVPTTTAGTIGVMALFRSPRAWAMAVFFGMQSFQAYVAFGWLPTVMTDSGLTQSYAAGMLAIVTACGIPISAIVPVLLGAVKRHEILVISFIAALALGYVGLMISPSTATWLLAVLIGVGLGSFPMALTLMALRARTHQGTTALSAFGQSVGYLLASAGPVGVGFLHDVTTGWTVPLIAMLISLIPMLIGGLVVVRRWSIEDDVRPRPAA